MSVNSYDELSNSGSWESQSSSHSGLTTSTESFSFDSEEFNEAAAKIQSMVEGFTLRKEIGQSRLNVLVSWLNGEINTLLKNINKVAERVESSWQSSHITQIKEVEVLDTIQSLRDQLLACQEKVNHPTDIKLSIKSDVDSFIDARISEFIDTKFALVQVCQDVGFYSLKQGLKLILFERWKENFSEAALKKIEDYSMVFVPTAYESYQDDGSDYFSVKLVNTKGDQLDEELAYFYEGVPYLTEMRCFSSGNPVEEIEGAELNVPYLDDEGKKHLIVFKGYFKRDPINVGHQLEDVERNKQLVEQELLLHRNIPESFQDAYFKQYPIRDFILKDPSDIAQDLVNDYEEFEQLTLHGLVPTLIFSFMSSSLAVKIRLLSLLLMEDDSRTALFLYMMMAGQSPQYVKILRETLHYSVQKKLKLALSEWKKIKKKMEEFDVDQIPYETRIAMSKMDDATKKKALEKLKDVNSGGHDAEKSAKYLNGLLQIPFGVYHTEPVNKDSSPKEISDYLEGVKGHLDSAVHGHEEAKEAILEWIAQRIANGSSKGECIALEGPPGVGKTTLVKQGIAKALGRPFVFIPMGGQSDVAYLVGHDFTYIGSNWGRIVELLRESQCMDPIIYFGEIDKVNPREKEAIYGVLKALTDFSQNDKFQEEYFSGVNFDLSQALFVFDYNDSSVLDRVLKDRLHIIKIGAQSTKEKLVITAKHLLPEILQSCGFASGDITIDDEEVKFLIENYTFEAGVRKLKENLFAIVRQLNLVRLREPDSISFPYQIDRDTILRFRKEPKIEFKKIPPVPSVGTVNGLYATITGVGGITIVQAFKTMANERLQLTLTGSQGDVMQESMSVARSVAWNLLPKEEKEKIYQGLPEGLHLHCPEGATPKDGPSAGGAITVAIVSQLLGIPIKNDVAMTGEIDLTGKITTIGGLSAKLQGAKRAGVKLAMIPRGNAKDLKKIQEKYPELIDDTFEVKIVDTIHDLLDNALVNNPITRPLDLMVNLENPPSSPIIIDGDDEEMAPIDTVKKKRALDEIQDPRKKMRI